MQDNIALALQNCVKIDDIQLKSEELEKGALVFRGAARDLKSKMWWKEIRVSE